MTLFALHMCRAKSVMKRAGCMGAPLYRYAKIVLLFMEGQNPDCILVAGCGGDRSLGGQGGQKSTSLKTSRKIVRYMLLRYNS